MKPFATTITTIMAFLTGAMAFIPNLLTPDHDHPHGFMLVQKK
jgi:hypothetical protein